jgi:hypothetical protein
VLAVGWIILVGIAVFVLGSWALTRLGLKEPREQEPDDLYTKVRDRLDHARNDWDGPDADR